MPFFSVIIPSYNRYDSLKKAIDSVLDQSFRDYELIVVDDGSTDQTPLIREEYKEKLIYLRQENSGVSRTRNSGISRSGSEYIAFLDSDDIWLQDKLTKQYDYIRDHPDILIHQTDEIWMRNGKRANPMKKHLKREGDIFIDSLELCLISPSAVVIKKEIFEKYGYFDEKLPVCEDYDLWLRTTCMERVGLIREFHIVKNGGNYDQLSGSFRGMDRFRIYSICKLLINNPGLKDDYRSAAVKSALRKCGILIDGAEKSGNSELVDTLKNISEWLNQGSCSKIDFSSLLNK